MGTPKLRLPWRGKTIIEHTIESWRASGVDRVLVVVRAGDEDLAALVRQSGGTVVVADPPPADMKASVQAGLAYVVTHEHPSDDDVWLTAPADLPSLSEEAIRRLLAAHHAAAPKVLVAGHQGRTGHPVLFPWAYSTKLAGLAAEEGINRLVELASPVVVECGAHALCADLDTPDDYKRWQDKSRG